MLTGAVVGLRARTPEETVVLFDELYNDVDNRARTDSRPWRPTTVDGPGSPYAGAASAERTEGSDLFAVVRLIDGELAGEASLWGVDTLSRSAHLGISLRPTFRGQSLGADVLRVLCDYGFRTRGLHRLQLETLADNAAMLASATRVGFVREGVLRRAAWVQGEFLDLVTLGLLVDEWGAGGGN